MSARGSCQINGTVAKKNQRNSFNLLKKTIDEDTTAKPGCKCHFYVKKKKSKTQQKLLKKYKQQQQQAESHHSTKRKQQRKSNVNMKPQQHLQQQQHLPQQPQQQQSQVQQMSLATNNNNQHTVVTMPALNTDFTSDSSYSSSSTSSTTTTSDGCSSTAPTGNAPSIGVNLRVTGQCSQGGRKYMEDYFSVAYQQSENAKDLEYAFIGIYDGHGGAEAATFAKEHLMMEIINQKLFWSDSDHDVLRAIREGYIATHYAMWREQEKWPKTANGLPSTAGTTATIAFIRREKIYIGHVGDSGIVLGYQNENEHFWRAQQLTTDHKPESIPERTRITRSGGKVVVKSGVPRVVWNRPRNAGHKGPIRRHTLVDEIPFLAVARSLGDLWSYNSARNEFVVSPDPDVKVIKINPQTFRCLIFGTDGLWNVVTPQEAVNTVYEKESINERLQAQRGESPSEGVQWTNPSKGLVEQALKTWSAKKMRADNTSVVTVILYPPCGNETAADGGSGTNAATAQQAPLLQPNSYGLEYTELHAEAITYEDATTYQEMAEKYLPPEEYRNFNYYADDDAAQAEFKLTPEEEATIDPMIMKYNRNGYMVWRNMDMRDKMAFSGSGNEWDCSARPQLYNALTRNIAPVDANSAAEAAEDDVEEDDDDDDDTDEEENADEEVASGLQHIEPATMAGYANYMACSTLMGEDANGGYMNSFAESYNCLLSEQIAQESASTSNSSNQPAYQSICGSSMHDLLQEQQLYQQQCMSEEDGYSLTKLETRREQQRCSAVQTFKIFQQHQETSTEASYMQPSAAAAVASGESDEDESAAAGRTAADMPYYWNPTECPTIASTVNRYAEYEQQKQQQLLLQQQAEVATHTPLELNSLLQQEREEEQRVALERLELQRHMVDATTATNRTLTTSESAQTTSEILLEETSTFADEPIVEEYLEEEEDEDETVQINEISSSSTMDIADEPEATTTTAVEHILVDVMAAPMIAQTLEIEQMETDEVTCAQIEEILTLPDKPKVPAKPKALTQHRNNTRLPPPAITKHTQQHYPNVPNENQQQHLLSSTSAHALHKSQSHCSNERLPVASTAGTLQKRELRSRNANHTLDYCKRTLRTRNSLAKELKAKTSLTTTLKRSVSVSSQFMRTTAASLLGGGSTKPTSMSASNVSQVAAAATACSRSNDNAHGSSSRKSKVPKLTILTSHHQHQQQTQPTACNAINLRSRQVVSNNSSKNVIASATACLNATSKLPVLRRERRNLRSVTAAKEAAAPSMNYSKSTRLQAAGNTLAAPPPSPKLMNAVAAVAAATRARSLVAAKNCLVVSSMFDKRAILRSSGAGSELDGVNAVDVGAATAMRSSRVVRRHKR